ncbi:AEC family transporter [Bifidobacterium samirii]|uniref:Permease n=1 Tax=Bifidobacterium samirii TaxID=2306974 RepID=A0A430FUP7_9BIFI|nr:AEC family transporter [Bifidobacterium samirii]RSX57188.1 permease [Bifidobacterium samirii]
MGQFTVVVGQLVGFFIMLMIGYGCVRMRFYGKAALDGMCALLLNVLIPVLVFANAVDGATRAQLAANWGVMLLSAVMYLLLIILFRIVAWMLRLRGSHGRVFQATMIFGNAGFLGIPLIMALFPENGAIWVALMSIVDQSLQWTYGVWLCEPVDADRDAGGRDVGGRTAVAGKPAGRTVGAVLRRFVNPALCAIVLSLTLIMLGVGVPPMLLTPLHAIGAMATPLSLIYLGGLFALTRWWGVLRRPELYVGMGVKMLCFPVALHALLTALAAAVPALPVTADMIAVISLVAGLPTMTAIAMFAARRDNMPDYATGFVLVSTLFSLCSLTVVSAAIF